MCKGTATEKVIAFDTAQAMSLPDRVLFRLADITEAYVAPGFARCPYLH